MSKSSDSSQAIPPWHLDCRIEADLPEDNVVGTRFLINAVFGALAVAALLVALFYFAVHWSIGDQMRDWANSG